MKRSYEKMEAVKVTFDAKEQMAAAACLMVNVGTKYDDTDSGPAGVCEYDYDAASNSFFWGDTITPATTWTPAGQATNFMKYGA